MFFAFKVYFFFWGGQFKIIVLSHGESYKTTSFFLREEDPGVAVSLSNLGSLYRDWKKYSDAEPLYRRALAIIEKANGQEHPSVGASLNNLAGLYGAMGNYAEAEPLFKRSLAILENALGADHLNVAAVLENYAVFLQQTSREEEAAEMESRAQAIREKNAQ